tara:strand:- start:97 stop:270 length:174 start_codon:yes stop_codon:yes gene_type:complete
MIVLAVAQMIRLLATFVNFAAMGIHGQGYLIRMTFHAKEEIAAKEMLVALFVAIPVT